MLNNDVTSMIFSCFFIEMVQERRTTNEIGVQLCSEYDFSSTDLLQFTMGLHSVNLS